MDEPRILYFTDTFPPQVNGVSVVTAISIAGLQARGWSCGVVAPAYPKPYGEAFAAEATGLSGVAVHAKLPSISLPPYPDIRLAAPRYSLVKNAIRRFAPDLIHCQTEFVVGRLGQRAAREYGIALVSSYHTDFSRYTSAYALSWARRYVTNYIARFHRRSERVFTPSPQAREDLANMDVTNVEVWGRSVDIVQFNPHRRSDSLRKLMGMDDSFTFLHVARLAPEKNVKLVIDGFRAVASRSPDRRMLLIIAGAGPQSQMLEGYAKDIDGIRFLGNLDRHGVLPDLYASADAFVYASETETLGLVILEAMASGLPVIATPVGGVGVNLRHMMNGLAFKAGDVNSLAAEMERIVNDESLRRRLSAGARDWAELNDWDAELDRLDLSYREVLITGARAEV